MPKYQHNTVKWNLNMRELIIQELSLVGGAGAISDGISTAANAAALGGVAGALTGARGGLYGAIAGAVIGAGVAVYESVTDDGTNYSGTNYN